MKYNNYTKVFTNYLKDRPSTNKIISDFIDRIKIDHFIYFKL